MICPRCKETLNKKNIDDENIDYCPSCEGMWVHKNQLNNLLKESHGDVELCSYDENPHTDVNPPISCRECADTEMKKINFLDFSDIIFDTCPKCGAYWLDKDELSQMHKYIEEVENGGHEVSNVTSFDLLKKLNEIAYAIFH